MQLPVLLPGVIEIFSRRCGIHRLQSKQELQDLAPWTSDGFSGFRAVWEKEVIDLVRVVLTTGMSKIYGADLSACTMHRPS